MSKRRFLLPILAAFLGLGALSGCGSALFSSSPSLSTSETSVASSTSPGSSVLPNSGTSSTPGSSVISSSTPIVDEGIDLTAPALSHQAVTPTDGQVVELANIGEKDITSIEQIPAEEVAMIKSLITKAFLSESQVHGIALCAKDFIAAASAQNYKAALAELTRFQADALSVLSTIDGDQIGYLLQEVAALAQSRKDETELPYGLIFGLANAVDYQGAMKAFGNNPGFARQFALYQSYFDGTTRYRENFADSVVSLPQALALALGRALRSLFVSFFDTFTLNEQVLFLTSIIAQIRGESFAYRQELAGKQQELLADPVPVVNHLGAFLLKIRFTSASWVFLKEEIILLLKAVVSAKKMPLFDARTVNITYLNGLLNFIDSKANVFEGETIAVLVKFLGLLASNFSNTEYLALQQAQGDIPVNPTAVLLAFYDKAYALLSANEKLLLTQLLANLGISYDDLYAAASSWKGLDISKETDTKKITDYLKGLVGNLTAFFTPSVKKSSIGVFFVGSYVLKDSSINPEHFDIDFYLPGDSREHYTIANIVAPTGELGYHIGTFTVSDSRNGQREDYVFSYDVVPTYLGIDPTQYPFFFANESELAYRNNILYLREDVTAADLRSRNISPFRFFEADGTSHNVAIVDPALSLVLSPNDNGTGFLLLGYQVSASLTIYGVIKVRYFTFNDVAYAPSDEISYVVEGGENEIGIVSYIPSIEGEQINLTFEWAKLTELGINPTSPGEASYPAHFKDHQFLVRLKVVAFSECKVTNVLEYLPYLQTVYHVGDAFNLLALRVACSYVDERDNTYFAGELLIHNPSVNVNGFSTEVPVASASGSIRYGDFEMDFTYTVLANYVDH